MKKKSSLLCAASQAAFLTIALSSFHSNIKAQCGNAALYQPMISVPYACSGATVRVSVPQLKVNHWIYRDSPGGAWTVISASNFSGYNHNVGTVSSSVNREYRAVVSAAGCSSDTSKAVMLSIIPPGYGNDNTVVPASSASSVCSGGSIDLSIVPINFGVTSWLYRDSSNGVWLPFGNSATSFSYNVGTVNNTVIRSVRALIRRNGQCQVDSSATINFTVRAITQGNMSNLVPSASFGTSTFFCSGAYVGLSVDYNSYITSIDRWLYRNAGSSIWTVFGSTSNVAPDTATNVSITTNREYRVLIKGPNCNIDSSGVATVQIPSLTAGNNPLLKPSINTTTVCSGGAVYLSIPFSPYVQTLGWVQRDNHSGPWVAVGPKFTSYTDVNTATIVPTVRSYRVITRDMSRCNADTSAEVSVLIKPNVYGSTTASVPLLSNKQVCEGVSVEVRVPSNATVWKWVYRDNQSGPWLTLSGASSTLSLVAVANRALRVILLDPQNCRIDTSTQVSVNVKPYTYNGGRTLLIKPVSSTASVCEGKALSISVSPVSPYAVHKWIFSDLGSGLWVDHPSSGNAIGNTFSLSSSTVRTYQTLLRNEETCVIDSSAALAIQLNKKTYGNLNTIAPFSPTSSMCSGGIIQQAIDVPAAYVVQNWIYRDNHSGSWQPIIGSNSSNINDAATVVSTNTIRSYRVLMLNESQCRLDTSAEASISIQAKTAGNNSAVVPRLIGGGPTTMCTGSVVQLTVSNPNFYDWSGWLYRDNDTGPWIPAGFPNNSFTDNQTHVLSPVSRSYRLLLTSPTACSIDTSGELAIQLLPYSAGRNTSDAPVPLSPGAFCSGSNIYLNYSTINTIQRWIYSDNNGPWYEVSGSSSGLIFDDNTSVGVNTTRAYKVISLRVTTCLVDTSGAANIEYFVQQVGAVPLSPLLTKASICAGSPATLSISLSPGQGILKWIYKDNNGPWMDVPGVHSTSVSDNNTKVSVNTNRLYKAIINNTYNCSYDSSLSASVMINPIQYGYVQSVTPVSTQSTVCKDASVMLSVSLTDPSASILNWMFKDNQNPWTNINSNLNQISNGLYNISPNSSRHYRVMIKYNGSCNIDSSAVLTVNVQDYSRGYNTVAPVAPTSLCVETGGMSNQVSINLNVFSGKYVIDSWLSRDGNAAWKPSSYFGLATTLNDPLLNVSAITTRSYRAIIRNSTTCSLDSTAIVSTLIMPITGSLLSTAVPTISSSPLCAGSPVQLALSPPLGYSARRWLYADNGNPWTLMGGSIGTFTGVDSNTQVINNIGRAYALVMRNTNTCRQDTSASVNVSIQALAATHGRLDTVAPIVAPAAVCSQGSVSLSINAGNGNKLLYWIYRDNQGPWHELPKIKASTLNHTVSPVFAGTLREYRTIFINSSVCRIDSSASDTLYINPLAQGNNNLNVFGPDTVCTGDAVSVYYNLPATASAVKWIYSDNMGPWQDIPVSNLANYSDDKTNTLTYISRRYRAIVFHPSICSMDSTNIKTVVLRPGNAGNSSMKASCQDTVCITVKSAYLSVASGLVLTWIYRDNFTGPWKLIPSSSSMSFVHNFPGFTGNRMREYRAIMLNANCGQDTTLADTTFIGSRSQGNVNSIIPVSSSAFVCSGSSATVTVSPGLGIPVVKWIYRNNHTGPWLTFAQANLSSITDYGTHTSVPMTRTYRAIIQRACGEDTTAGFTLSIMPYVAGNSSQVPGVNSSSVCAGIGIAVSIAPGVNNSVFKWIYRNGTSGPWLDLAYGLNSAIDNNTLVTVSTQRQYRAILSILGSCGHDTTAIQTVTILPVQHGNIAVSTTATMTNTCSGSAVSVSSSSNSVERWVYNTNGSAWKSYPYAKNGNFTDYNTKYSSTTVKAYRALVYDINTCKLDTSLSGSVVIQPHVYGNDNSFTFTGPSTLCSVNSDVITISSPGSGNYISHWIYRDNSSSPWRLLNDTSSTITVNDPVSNSIVRQYRAIVVKGSGCRVDSSNAFNITITPPAYGNDTISPNASKNSICYRSSVTLSINVSSSAVRGWIYRDNGTGPWLRMAMAGYSIITDNNTWVNSSISRAYRALILKSNCQVDTSAEKVILINFPTRGNVAYLPWANDSSICNNTPADLYSNIAQVNAKGWIYQVDNGPWKLMPGTAEMNIIRDYGTYYDSTVVKSYRLLIENTGLCSIDTSLSVSITINFSSYGSSSIVPQAARLSICGGHSASLSISSGTISKWLYRDNHAGPWLDVPSSAGKNTLNDYNTNVLASLQRTYKALLLSGAGCTVDTSAGTSITIKPQSKGNSPITAQASKSNICSGATVAISINPGTSTIASWITRDYANPWIPAGIGTGNIVNLSNTNRTVLTTRSYRALLVDSLACTTDTSEAAIFTIQVIGTGSDSNLVPMALTPFICSGSIAQVNIAGNVKAWVIRDTISNAWTVLQGQTGNTASNYIVTSVVRNRSYRAIVFNDSTCTNDTTRASTITINPVLRGLQNVQTTATSNMICTGSPLELSISNYTGNVLYWLYRDNGSAWNIISNSNKDTIQPNTVVTVFTTREYLVLLDSACKMDSTLAVGVNIGLYPVIPKVNQSGDTLICLQSSGLSYQWKRNGVDLAGANSTKLLATQSGIYTVEVTNTAGCKNTSDPFSVIMATEPEAPGRMHVELYPNPAKRELNIEITGIQNNKLSYRLLNMMGQEVQGQELIMRQGKATLNLDGLAEGVYIVILETEGQRSIKQLMISQNR